MDKQLKKIVDESRNIVFFGGAGVSTESNIPDFRSPEGLYKTKQSYGYPAEEMLSHTWLMRHQEMFFDYYKNNLVTPWAKPNKAHKALAYLEKIGKLKAVVTQNIDGLHQDAGSKKVFELHGTTRKNYCMKCGEKYGLDYTLDKANCDGYVPKCRKCGGVVRPDVVLYEEALNGDCIEGAIMAIERADTMIVGGTSLVVYPAAGLLDYFRGRHLVLINKEATARDSMAELVIRDSIGTALDVEGEVFEGI